MRYAPLAPPAARTGAGRGSVEPPFDAPLPRGGAPGGGAGWGVQGGSGACVGSNGRIGWRMWAQWSGDGCGSSLPMRCPSAPGRLGLWTLSRLEGCHAELRDALADQDYRNLQLLRGSAHGTPRLADRSGAPPWRGRARSGDAGAFVPLAKPLAWNSASTTLNAGRHANANAAAPQQIAGQIGKK